MLPWRRVARALSVYNLRKTQSWPVKLRLGCRVFNYVNITGRTSLNIPLVLAGLNVDIFGFSWPRYASTSVGQGTEGRNHSLYDIDTPEFVQIVKEHNKGDVGRLIIDVREPEELAESGQIPGTVNIPLGEVEGALRAIPDIFRQRFGVNKPSQETDIIFYCMVGVRSLTAVDIATKLGYPKSRHYRRGYLGWQEHMQSQHSA